MITSTEKIQQQLLKLPVDARRYVEGIASALRLVISKTGTLGELALCLVHAEIYEEHEKEISDGK